MGLGSPTEAHLRQIVPPVLASFTDQDGRVRYYACEALYNIAKVLACGGHSCTRIFHRLCILAGCILAWARPSSVFYLFGRLIYHRMAEIRRLLASLSSSSSTRCSMPCSGKGRQVILLRLGWSFFYTRHSPGLNTCRRHLCFRVGTEEVNQVT